MPSVCLFTWSTEGRASVVSTPITTPSLQTTPHPVVCRQSSPYIEMSICRKETCCMAFSNEVKQYIQFIILKTWSSKNWNGLYCIEYFYIGWTFNPMASKWFSFFCLCCYFFPFVHVMQFNIVRIIKGWSLVLWCYGLESVIAMCVI